MFRQKVERSIGILAFAVVLSAVWVGVPVQRGYADDSSQSHDDSNTASSEKSHDEQASKEEHPAPSNGDHANRESRDTGTVNLGKGSPGQGGRPGGQEPARPSQTDKPEASPWWNNHDRNTNGNSSEQGGRPSGQEPVIPSQTDRPEASPWWNNHDRNTNDSNSNSQGSLESHNGSPSVIPSGPADHSINTQRGGDRGQTPSPPIVESQHPLRPDNGDHQNIQSNGSGRGDRGVPDDHNNWRKDWADIGQSWRDHHDDHSGGQPHDTHSTHSDSHINININIFTGRYHHYTYDYRPGFCYPSLYCYFDGLFPPYVDGLRVEYIGRHFGIIYTYVDLPVTIIDVSHRDYGYYSPEWTYRGIADTLLDVREAWERSDIDLLMRHVRQDEKIDMFLKGEYSYSVDPQDYYDMTLDAMSNIKTSSLEFYKVKERVGTRELVAYGKHIYYDDSSRDKKTIYVAYTFIRSGSDWYITEIGTSPDKL